MNVKNDENCIIVVRKWNQYPTVISSSSMWVHSINKERETHGKFAIIFIGICLLLNSNGDKNYMQNITSVKFL